MRRRQLFQAVAVAVLPASKPRGGALVWTFTGEDCAACLAQIHALRERFEACQREIGKGAS